MENPNFNLTKEDIKIKKTASKKTVDDYTNAKILEKQSQRINPLLKEKVSSFEDINMPSSNEVAPIKQGSNIMKEGDINVSLKLKPPVAKFLKHYDNKEHVKVSNKEGLEEEEEVKEGENIKKEEDKKGRFNKRKPPADPKIQIIAISHKLLKSNPTKYSNVEMEVKFGTRGIKRITKTDYDNVIKKISSMGFTTNQPEGNYTLKIQAEFLDLKSGMYKISNDFDRFRVEINEITNIQEFCKNGNIQKLFNSKSGTIISIMKKTDVFENDEPVQSADFNDFNFRVTYKNEESISANSKIGKELLSNWDKSKKQFRYINRVSFIHPLFPFRIDFSIVRSSTKDNKGQLIKTYNVI